MFKKISIVLIVLSFFAVIGVRAQDNTPLLVVELGNQPSASMAPANAWEKHFMYFTLTALRGDADITNIVVKRVGNARDGAFSSVQLRELETGQDIGKAREISSSSHEHNTRYRFTIKQGEKRTFVVLGNMNSSLGSFSGEQPQFSIVRIDSNATAQGLPVTGPVHTINSTLTIGSISVDKGSLESGGGQTFQVGQNYTFNSLKADVGSAEPIRLEYVIWTQSGSIGPEDIVNLTTHVTYKGQTQSFPTFPYSTGSYPEHEWISALGEGIRVGKGESVQIRLSGDVVSGVGRTVDFVDYTKVYVLGTGVDFGYGILGYNVNEASAHTVAAGSINVSPWTHFFTYYKGEPNIGTFNLRVAGEPKEVSRFEILLGSAQAKSVKIWDSKGNLVAGPSDTSVSSKVTFNVGPGVWTVPVGETTYTVTGSASVSLAGRFNFEAKGIRTGFSVVRNEF